MNELLGVSASTTILTLAFLNPWLEDSVPDIGVLKTRAIKITEG